MDKQTGAAPQGTTPREGDEPEVEGHIHPMHPDLARDLHDARHRELVADADLDRELKATKDTGRDGGILDRIRRFAGRES